MTEEELYKNKIHQYDFALLEGNLFLDTHPECKKALEVLNELRNMRAELIKNYEQRFGTYIASVSDAGKNGSWDWINSPWPWEDRKVER